MVVMAAEKWLTFTAAATRVGRSRRVIRLWGQQGMPLAWKTIDGQRTRVVREDVLMATFREKLKNNPSHQAKMRRIRRESGLPETVATRTVARGLPRQPQLILTGRPSLDADLDAPRVDPLADMAPMRAGAEWRDVGEAMKRDDPACWGIDAFTADTVDDEEQLIMAGICAGCPMIDLCRTFAVREKPAAGFWAGEPASTYRRRTAAA